MRKKRKTPDKFLGSLRVGVYICCGTFCCRYPSVSPLERGDASSSPAKGRPGRVYCRRLMTDCGSWFA